MLTKIRTNDMVYITTVIINKVSIFILLEQVLCMAKELRKNRIVKNGYLQTLIQILLINSLIQ